ncbi:MAG: bifunctional tRNA (5-methylaminomethyl-2-thiouridine)(34)-methyltransferase MnmD/FAD-dependent 5-carboxymethylaminomethyl-2-thiouridine(34) oxidoreductase MnmC [Hyphomonadaceae bacterium]|nr:bifunctional tRNA (5-methylaminomethyl-2-thiouridine)(34)-methyltransferase MnmD/FAD-dependent 5-carboxymethylaminomethyl-2-thiouridine(34) oxidoreductase MnmC [Hyphomonadaceae bacterium]
MTPRRLPPHPALDWSAEGLPEAAAFGDVYFSKAGGLAESEAVFLAGCGLPDAWKRKDRFAVCELGFGTGLNVLALWNAWKKTRLPHAQLHISTIEAFPLARADAARALAHFPEISALSAQLLARWPVRAYAPQRLWFPEDRFSLTVFTGAAEAVLPELEGAFDAWFLDGFAPARNADMWSEAVFAEMARLSAPGARAATFTVAGHVRRGLESAGFAVEKRPGFGAKRERLEAVFREDAAQAGQETPTSGLYPYEACKPKRVAIIGAGIAGAACAQALTRRGVEAVAVEAAVDLGAGASGNPAGLVMPRLDRGGGPLATMFLAAYLEAIATYEALGVFEACGVEQRPQNERDAAALADLLADPPLPDEWFSALRGGALHARAGLVRPLLAIEAMLEGAKVLYETPVHSLDAAEGGGWLVRGEGKRAILRADAVVLACGAALKQFESASFLPITLSRGQIEWGAGRAPEYAVTSGSYVAPYENGVLFGATFDNLPDGADFGEAPTEEARARNLAALAHIAPEIAASIDATTLRSRVSYRATTPDRAPIAGLLPDAPAWLAHYEGLAHGRAINANAPPPAHAGIYVLGGFGARGLTLAPLLGERIAAEMCGDIMPLPKNSLDAIHPARFLHRALKRR